MKLPENSLRVGPASISYLTKILVTTAHKLAQPISFWKSFPLQNVTRRNPLMNGLPLPLAVRLGYPASFTAQKRWTKNDKRERSFGEKVNYGQLIEVMIYGCWTKNWGGFTPQIIHF